MADAQPRPAPDRPDTDRPDTDRPDMDAARARLALAQTALLSALVAGGPVPEGFDRERLHVQRQALAARRATVMAKVAPELPALLGERYRPAALRHARDHPMTGGYRQCARAFAEYLLHDSSTPLRARERRRLKRWLRAGR
jgi:hypothetical protein